MKYTQKWKIKKNANLEKFCQKITNIKKISAY